MKKCWLVLLLLGMSSAMSLYAQKWSDLSNEEKLSKLQAFKDDNQNYMRNTLKLTEEQVSDVENVNICYLSTLDRINRYGKTDADKEKYAKSVTQARSAQLDAIMGVDKRNQYMAYVSDKLKKAQASLQ